MNEQELSITYTLEQWQQEGTRRFGEDKMNWKFVCPACGRITSVKEMVEAGAEPDDAVQKCMGRINGKGGPWGKDTGDGCNWAAYGLFKCMGKGAVVLKEGREVDVFQFAPMEGNQ